MEARILDLDKGTFMFIMIPTCGIMLLFNLFYVYCLIYYRHKLRHPLMLMLPFIISCSITFVIYLFFSHSIIINLENSRELLFFLWMFMTLVTHSSMTCSTWVSFYYCMQIVPPKTAFLTWVRKNLMYVTYLMFLYEELLVTSSLTLNFSTTMLEIQGTSCSNCTRDAFDMATLKTTNSVFLAVLKIHILYCVVLTGVCNSIMTHYLLRHIKKVVREGITTSGITGQMRVVVSEFFQSVFFFICGLLYFLDLVSFEYSVLFKFGPVLSHMVTLLYMMATTVNLGVCQVIFRQGAIEVWKALSSKCRSNI